MRHAPQGGFDTADHDRGLGIKLFQHAGIDRGGVVRSETDLPAGGVGVLTAGFARGRVAVHHRVHATRGDAKKQAGRAEFLEVTQVITPVRLRQDGYLQPLGLEQAANNRGAEGGVIDVGVARDDNHVELIPTTGLHLVGRSRQPARWVPDGFAGINLGGGRWGGWVHGETQTNVEEIGRGGMRKSR